MNEQQQISRRGLVATAAVLACGVVPALAQSSPEPSEQKPAPEPVPATLRTVVLVRHAEKSTEGDPKDPGLSEAGKLRAASHHANPDFSAEDLRDLRAVWRVIEMGLLALTPDHDIDFDGPLYGR